MPFSDAVFLKACRREPVPRPPVWLMRQAGRYMPEYRALREKHDLLTLCRTPELAAEVTLQPVRAFAVDAAILFTDLLIPLPSLGLDLAFEAGEGPVIRNPLRGPEDVKALKPVDPESAFPYLFESIRMLKAVLNVPLIGFAGAPFTLASYMIEGGHSRHFIRTKRFMLEAPEGWKALMTKLAGVSNRSLKGQALAGADAVQLFDSWAGILSPEDYREFVLPYSKMALDGVEVPRIHFGTGTGGFLEALGEAGAEVVGVDWRTPLAEAFRRLPEKAVQGNLDPALLLGPEAELRRRTRRLLEAGGGRPGWIFNLGHGILPETPVENVRALVSEVHSYKSGSEG